MTRYLFRKVMEEAEEKAKEYWDEKFPTMFGGVEFMKEVEELAQQLKNGGDLRKSEKHSSAKGGLPEEFDVLRLRLSTFLKTKVQMTCSAKGKGKISIPFANEQELERLMNIFDKLKD